MHEAIFIFVTLLDKESELKKQYAVANLSREGLRESGRVDIYNNKGLKCKSSE
jgi:hypothetical protein